MTDPSSNFTIGPSMVSQGVNAYQGLSDVPESTQFDLIYSKDVLEHLLNPVGEIKTLMTKLKPDGWLVLMTPNAASIRSRLQRGKWKELRKDGHLVMFTPRSIQRLLTLCDVRVQRLHFRINFGGSWAKQTASDMMQKLGVDGELRYAGRFH